jgi:hypothetical protein
LRDPAANALIADLGGTERVASSFAWYQTSKSLAASFGRALAGFLLGVTASGFPVAFAASFILSAIHIYVVGRHVRETSHRVNAREVEAEGTPEASPGPAGGPPSHVLSFALRPRTWLTPGAARPSAFPYLLLGMLISGTAYMMSNLFPILAVEYAGLTPAQTGLIFLLAPLVMLLGPVFGWLSDNVSHKLVLAMRSAANVISSVLYLAAPSLVGYAAARLVDDTGKAAYKPTWGALMARVAGFDRRSRTRTMGLLSLGDDAGEVLGPILAGFLWSTWGIGVLFSVRILLALVTEVYTAILARAAEPADSGAAPGVRYARGSAPAAGVPAGTERVGVP